MKFVIQRVKYATLKVNNEVISSIQKGIVVYVGFTNTDNQSIIVKSAQKLAKMRIFEDDMGKLNKDVNDISGSIMCVSNFTLYGKAEKGHRPDYMLSAKADIAKPMYDDLLIELAKYAPTVSGVFGADMQIEMQADGPVNIILELN